MATIRNRGESQWEALIRRKGYPAQRKTFETKSDAQAWAGMIESELERVFVLPKTRRMVCRPSRNEERSRRRDPVEEQYILSSLCGRVLPTAADTLKKAFVRCLERAKLKYLGDCRLAHVIPQESLLINLRHEATATKPSNPTALACLRGGAPRGEHTQAFSGQGRVCDTASTWQLITGALQSFHSLCFAYLPPFEEEDSLVREKAGDSGMSDGHPAGEDR